MVNRWKLLIKGEYIIKGNEAYFSYVIIQLFCFDIPKVNYLCNMGTYSEMECMRTLHWVPMNVILKKVTLFEARDSA